MKAILSALFGFAALGWAQTPIFSLDAAALAQYCPTAKFYSSADQADMDQLPVPYNTLLMGQRWTCAIPVSCTVCKVTIGFVENRSTNIGPGKRVFTVSFNGMVSDPIDLFKLAGSRTPYRKSWTVPGFDGILRLSFQTLVNGMNAIASLVEIIDVTPVGPAGKDGKDGADGNGLLKIVPAPARLACDPALAFQCAYDPATNTWSVKPKP